MLPSISLKALALKLAKTGPVRTLPTPRLVQILFNGRYILKTTKSVFVWEHPYYPQLYIPASELQEYFEAHSEDLKITPGEEIQDDDDEGGAGSGENGTAGNGKVVVATQWKLTVKDKTAEKVMAFSADLKDGPAKDLAGLVKIDFASMDQWLEESTPIFVHPKDPFKRIDILQSSRHVRVSVKDQTGQEVVVADSHTSMHLYETGLPCRFYLPLDRVDASVLRKTATKTMCPYKGEAEYYDVVLPDGSEYGDVIWYYNRPTLESGRVEGECNPGVL